MKCTFSLSSGRRTGFACACLLMAGALALFGCSRKRPIDQAANGQVAQPVAQTPAEPSEGATTNDVPAVDTAAWPREYGTDAGQRVVLYEPEVEQWNDFETMRVRAALEVREPGAGEALYGALWMSGRTDTDTDSRRVLLTSRQIDELRFPGSSEADAGRMRQIVDAALPASEPFVFNLDRILASVEGPVQGETGLDVSLDPPPVFYSSQPAMLIIFLGEPAFDVVRDGSGLEFCVNTNWDLFRVTATGRYYVQVEDGWMQTDNVLEGPWLEVPELPAIFAELPDDENWTDVRANTPGKKLDVVPQVFVSTQPAEMIVTAGPAEYEELPGTALSYVVNTDSTVFVHREERNFYFLAAGRWFRAPALQGPWLAATFDLPEDFLRLPEGEEWADVRAAVPGTADAQEAALLASIPRKAEVSRSEAALEVDYDGEPIFAPIEGAQNISYATNTQYDVLSVTTGPGTQYYACHQGVWFVSDTPHGPWVLCDSVPDPVYTIPPSSPKYNVTYVRVYESTPTTVVTGYYPGYVGTYVVGGALLFGLGYWIGSEIYDDDHHHHHHHHYWRSYRYRPYWYSYGCGARYHHSHGGYVRAARYYGPYGGVGRMAVWNPYSRGYMRGHKAYGPRGDAWARGAYQPFTDTWRGRVRATTPYATWGRSAVTQGERWREARRWEERRRADAGELVSAGRGNRDGKPSSAGGDDLKVARDGQVYRQKDKGWEKWEKNKGWESAAVAGGSDGPERAVRGGRGQVAISRPGGRGALPGSDSRIGRDGERIRERTDENPDPPVQDASGTLAEGESGRTPGGRERNTDVRDAGEETGERPAIVDGRREGAASGNREGRRSDGDPEETEPSEKPSVADEGRQGDGSERRGRGEETGRLEGGEDAENENRDGGRARESEGAEGSRAERRPGIVDGSRENGATPRRRVTGDGSENPPGPEAKPEKSRPNTAREPQTSTRDGQPSTRQGQPATRERQPSTRQQQPSMRERQPSTRPQQPSTRERQPSTRPQQPSTRERQPSTRPQQPSTRQTQPPARQENRSRSSGGQGREREREGGRR